MPKLKHVNYEPYVSNLNIWTNSINVIVLYSALFARDIIAKCIINNIMGMGLSINTVRLMLQIICVKMVALWTCIFFYTPTFCYISGFQIYIQKT